MLKKLSLQALQFALNQALGLDKTITEKLKPLQGKIIEIVIMPLQVHFYICIENEQMILLEQTLEKPDTIIHSRPLGLIRLSLLPSSKARSLFNDEIQISGDVELGRKLKKIFDSIHVDWEGHLAYFTGDVVAHHIGKIVRKGRHLTNQYADSFKKHTHEYLVQEMQWVPEKQELEQFYKDVDDLRLRTERLAAHIEYLLAHHEKH
ncbi:MAG: hypothetical protein EBQ95_06995 [Gammaproteobacteria bacterium]|nr:hypothetical protein [Gammaproteobacteria bacterium]